MHPKPSNEPTLLRRPQVQQRTGLSRTTLYESSRTARFPLRCASARELRIPAERDR